MELTREEATWLDAQRRLRQQVFVGIDHHAAQLTVSAALGERLLQRATPQELPVQRFAQDVYGYRELLAWLAQEFPQANQADIWFVAEPTYAQPLGHFLRRQGFATEQVLWVNPTKVPQYRKAHDLSKTGKNDDSDAQVLVLMLFDARVDPSSRLRLFAAVPPAPVHENLRQLAEEYQRLTHQSVQLQNKILQLVLLLFPELRRLFVQRRTQRKPDGSRYQEVALDLFEKATPLEILGRFPSPRAIMAAGFEGIWSAVGKQGVRRATIRQLLQLAQDSAGVPDDLAARRLGMLIEEYQRVQQQLEQYRTAMRELLEADPVLASFLQIPCLSEVMLATLVGEMGNLDRFQTTDELKRYLGLAPKPLPQTGQVDERGKVVQIWRMPSNTYKVVQGRKRLVAKTPGKHAPRRVAWLWFDIFLRNSPKRPDDPFVQLYLRYKAKHQGRTRWLGRVRWKVVGKLIHILFTCLKRQQPYDPVLTRFAA